uniref:Complex 1 LYR protein domain-containing protein n=1 Tax=Cucumis sativus TaxID=3659 RepID=A0A0A0LGK2_CUCSA
MVFSHDLREFILRARVLKLYRQDELRHMMREEMEKNRKCNDRQKIRFLLSEGIERLKRLDEMLDMQGH